MTYTVQKDLPKVITHIIIIQHTNLTQ